MELSDKGILTASVMPLFLTKNYAWNNELLSSISIDRVYGKYIVHWKR